MTDFGDLLLRLAGYDYRHEYLKTFEDHIDDIDKRRLDLRTKHVPAKRHVLVVELKRDTKHHSDTIEQLEDTCVTGRFH